MPPDFRYISPLVSQANLSRLQQACQLDGDVALSSEHDYELSAPSASSLAQQEREFQKAEQPSSPISTFLNSARHPLMVAPDGIGTARRTLLRKFQAAEKEAAATKSTAKTLKASSRLQGITEEGTAAYEKQGEEVRINELQSQKARIVVPTQVPPLSVESPFEDAENVAPESAQGGRRVRVRAKETLGEPYLHTRFLCRSSQAEQNRQATLWLLSRRPPRPKSTDSTQRPRRSLRLSMRTRRAFP
jgi:cell cycle serine/threonine-protein kinase CDC5/MSD2